MATEFIEISEEEYQGGAGDFIEITEEEFNAPAEELDQPFFALEDAVSAIGTIPEALSVGVPAAFKKLVTGTAMPEESEAMEKDIAFQERMRQEQQDRQAAGKSSMVGEAIREATPSIATSFGGLGAGIAGAVGGTVVGGPVGATVGGMAASGTASYRMAAADLLYRSFKALEEQKGSPLTEDEKAQAYKEFLPLAQNSALWEAGPEAVSNAVLLGAGKFVFGFGKPLAKKLVGESIERVNKGIASKVAAGTGAVAAELGTETITALGQFAPEMAAQKYTRTGTTEGAPTEYPGGAMQAFKDVAPATLALTGMMAGAGGVAKAATLPFQKAKTPEQIEEDNINLDADREADNLLIPDNDTESKSIKSQIDTERADLAIKKELYNTLPDGDKTKAVLATEIKEYEGRITGLDNTLRQRLGLSLPITTAEQQQIELAKQIARKPAQIGAMPSPAAQTAEATYGAATGVYDVFGGITRKPVSIPKPAVTPAAEVEGDFTPPKNWEETYKAATEGSLPSESFYSPDEILLNASQSTNDDVTLNSVLDKIDPEKSKNKKGEYIVWEIATRPNVSSEVKSRAENLFKQIAPEKNIIQPVSFENIPEEQQISDIKNSGIEAIHYSRNPMELKKGVDFSESFDNVFDNGFYAMEPSDELYWSYIHPLGKYKNKIKVNPKNPILITPETLRKYGYDAINQRVKNKDYDAIIVRGWREDQYQKITDLAEKNWKKNFPEGNVTKEQKNAELDKASIKLLGVNWNDYSKLNDSQWDQNQIFIQPDAATEIVSTTPAVSETITPAAEPAGKPKLGEKGGVLIPSREDFIQAGQNIYEAGMEFGTWAKQMIQRFGDAVRQFLGDVWEAVSGFPAKLEEMAGYLPGKGERGAVTFGRGEEPPKKPVEPAPEKPAMDRYNGKAQVAGVRGIGAEKDTPKGINKKTEEIIKDRVFDATIVNDNQTKKAWNLIQKIEEKNPESGKNAQAINELTRETMQDVEADEVVKQSIGAVKLRNELYSYAIKLAGEGDPKMLNYLLNTRLSIGSGNIVEGDAGRLLQAMASLKSWIVRATEAEQQGFFDIAAQQFFGTKTPTDEQVQQIKNIFNKVKEVKIDQEKELMDELEEVGKAAGVDLPAAVDKQLENTPGLDPMVVAMTAMQKLYGGTITTQYEPISKRAQGRFEGVKKIIQGGISNYRQKIVSKAANGLETGFWKTLSSTEQKPGPLGELDSAQNQALGNIVKQALVKMGLQGTPPNTKMSIYEQVASILGEQPLSQDKINMADEKIRGGIESKRQAELENATEDQQEAINLKYDEMTFAWDNAMSRSLDMPVSDTMLRRMILNELKEADTSIQDIAKLMEEEPVIGASRQDRYVESIIEKIIGSGRYLTRINEQGKPEADYANLKSYLSNLLENMVLARQQKNKAAKDVAKTRRDASGDPEKQAQAQIDRLAKIQADPTIFGEKKIDLVRNAVRDALSLQLNIGFTPEQSAKIKNNWKGAFVADPNKKGIPTSFMLELQRLGVSEAAANTLADIVWRQIEVNAMSRQMDATTKAVEAGPIGGIVQAILDTPLANQQDPEWRKNVILDYLKNAGVKPSQAENIAKLFDVSLRKRFAKAQEEAAIKAAKSIKGGLTTNSKRALEKFLKAIRAQVLDPGKDVAKAFAEEMGWKGFTKDQIVRLNELDAIVNDNERTDAEIAVATEQIQKIIDKVSMPPQVKEVLASFYIGNALMRFPTFAVQAFDPLAMTTFNTAIESFRNITNPQQFIQTWVNYGRAISNLARETAFSYKNDILRSGRMIDYLDNQDRKIKRLADESVRKFKAGDIRGAMKDGIIGYTAWTFRTLKALDDGAYSLLTSTTLPQYVEAALKNAKIPREKRRGVMRQVLEAREMDIKRMVADGVSKNDAVIYANERMQAAITKELSGLNIDAQEVINSAINDALARIGKTRFAEDILTGKVEEIKDLGTISAPFLRWYESVSKSVSGSGSESQKIFYRILLGFPLIPARIFNIAAGYTPLTIYRHALKNRYSLTYGTALQRRQRLAEQLAGTMVLLPLLALRSNSTDEEDEKEKGFGVYITGQGPSKMKDKTLHAKWNDRHDPFSLEFRMGGKTKFSIDAKAAGPLSVMIYLLGAMDDWETNRRLDGLKTSKDDWKEAQDKASIFTSLYELGGYAVLTTARRGPTTGVMQGLVDFRRFPDDPIAAIGADISFSAMPAVPILGTGIAKNLSDFFSQPIENTTKEGAILSNIPIVGPIAGKPALNSYGQKLGELRISEKLKKSFGVPFTLVVSDNEEDNKLTSLTLKFGDGPTPLRREDVENELKSAISDGEWYLAAKTFGDRNRSYVLKNYNRYEKMKPAGFSKVMSALGKASKANAISAVKKARRNNP